MMPFCFCSLATFSGNRNREPSETKDERTKRDIFPFVTWDTGPAETRVSFLWRLLHYERRGERRGGHVLFVPWGDV